MRNLEFSRPFRVRKLPRDGMFAFRLGGDELLAQINRSIPSRRMEAILCCFQLLLLLHGFILSTWDRAIDLSEKLIAAKTKRKHAITQQLLSRNGRLNSSSSLKMVKLSSLLRRVNDPVTVDPTSMYREIGIRSHGKGIFHKEPTIGKNLGDKRVFKVHPDCFVFNVVFAWEQAIAKTTDNEREMIASHRFPMYQSIDNKIDLDFLLYFFKTSKGKDLLGLASPGGAGRNRTLSQTGFLGTSIPLPPLKQQRAIAVALSAMDSELDLLMERCNCLQQQKRGLMQQLLTGKVRVNNVDEPPRE